MNTSTILHAKNYPKNLLDLSVIVHIMSGVGSFRPESGPKELPMPPNPAISLGHPGYLHSPNPANPAGENPRNATLCNTMQRLGGYPLLHSLYCSTIHSLLSRRTVVAPPFVPSCLRAFVPSCLRAFVPTCLPPNRYTMLQIVTFRGVPPHTLTRQPHMNMRGPKRMRYLFRPHWPDNG
jgi:hypothetical protein